MFRPLSAIVVLLCVSIFYMINLWNLVRKRRLRRHGVNSEIENEEEVLPKSLVLGVSALFTLIFWFIVIAYPFLVYFGFLEKLSSMLMAFDFPFISIFNWLGLAMLVFGFLLFKWSIIARGQYATSWRMPQNHKLVTWGPYSLVRHPSYLSYFIMFFGLFLLWPNLLTLTIISAIPGYVKITVYEEEMLIRRFGDEYRGYQRRVGKFFPRNTKDKKHK